MQLLQRIIFILCVLFIPILTFSQVGIGTLTPDSSAILDVSASNRGILVPRINLTSSTMKLGVANNADGLMIYNIGTTFSKGYYFWNSVKWLNIDGKDAIPPQITGNLICNSASLFPATYTSGSPYTGTLKIPYTGGNGGQYSSNTILTSTGVLGLQATLNSNSLAFGNGELIYSVSGTPNNSSPAAATFTIPNTFGASGCNVRVGGGDFFKIGETRSFAVTGIAMSTLSQTAPNRTIMTGKAVTNTGNTDRKLLIETAGLNNNSSGILIINGLRMDFRCTSSSTVDPVLLNTTSNPIIFSVSSLSTVNGYVNGVKTTIAPNAISYRVDGDSNFNLSNNDSAEYVNCQISFSDGSWYLLTFFATQIDGLINGYWTATRLN